MKDNYLVPLAIIAAGLIIAGAVFYGGGKSDSGKTPSLGDDNAEIINVSADDDPFKGSPDAPVTIIEFSDYECPFCGSFFRNTLPELEEKYINTGKVKFIYRDFPISSHKNAQVAAEAAQCSGDQGKYWEMHNKIFENQEAIAKDNLIGYAGVMGLNMDSFNQCLNDGKYSKEVKADLNDGVKAGVDGTPTFFINGQKLVGAQPFSVFEEIIEKELAGK